MANHSAPNKLYVILRGKFCFTTGSRMISPDLPSRRLAEIWPTLYKSSAKRRGRPQVDRLNFFQTRSQKQRDSIHHSRFLRWLLLGLSGSRRDRIFWGLAAVHAACRFRTRRDWRTEAPGRRNARPWNKRSIVILGCFAFGKNCFHFQCDVCQAVAQAEKIP